ncbi:MAG: hypothetical protein ACFE91_12300 [Promethearchaeota archaeon]
MSNVIVSRAPVRICDIGGWTDTWFYPKGAVFNISVDLYSNVRIIQNNKNKIKIVSENLNLQTLIQDFNKIEYNGNLDLLKAAVKRMNIKEGIDINIRANAPAGCGTGTSASVAVALISALSLFSHKDLKPEEIAKLAHKLEIEELRIESGVQDQYAAAFGGINFMEINYPSVKIIPIKLDNDKIHQLEDHLILVYLSSRSSDEMHKAVIRNYQKGDKSTINSLNAIRNYAYEMKSAIYSGDLELIGNIINKNWEAQQKLHPLMTNSLIKKTEQIARKNGAIGFKLNGAGGGGSATILAAKGSKNKIKQELIKEGLQILPIKIDFNGVYSWIDEINDTKF